MAFKAEDVRQSKGGDFTMLQAPVPQVDQPRTRDSIGPMAL